MTKDAYIHTYMYTYLFKFIYIYIQIWYPLLPQEIYQQLATSGAYQLTSGGGIMTFEDCKAEIQGGGLWSGHGASLGPICGGNGWGELGELTCKFQSLHPRNLTN